MSVEPRLSFGRAVDAYERARPQYAADAVAWIAERLPLGRVLDLGAGTGKLTRQLLGVADSVVAVEPDDDMRAMLERVLPHVESLRGSAEAIPLPDASVDAVTVAQAFHWFDLDRALPEIHRVLRPGGRLALVWNMRDLDDPVQRGVEDLLAPLRGRLTAQREGKWRAPLAASPLFGEPETAEFRYEQQFTGDDLVDRVASTSFVAAMADDKRRPLLDQVRALAAGRPEPFPFPYLTEVLINPRMP